MAANYGWKPETITILQEVTDDGSCLSTERYWIERFAARYGVAECARVIGGPKTYRWCSKYKVGRMLNLHSNDASVALEGSRTAEARAKMTETRTLNGSRQKSVEAMYSSLTHESRKLAASRKDYSEISKRVARTKKGTSGTYRICSVLFEGKEYVGSVQTVCREIGHENWNVHLSRKFKSGLYEVEHHGLHFKLLCVNKRN